MPDYWSRNADGRPATGMSWIVRNRQVRDRVSPVGECIPDHEAALAGRKAIREAVAAFVDDEFRAHCALGRVEADRVVILVDSAAAAAVLRRQWLTVLRSHLVDTCRAFRARRLEFRIGLGDDRFMADVDRGGPARA